MSGISNHCCKSAQIITLREEVESWSWVTFASELTTIRFRGTSLSSPHSLNWASKHTEELCNVTWGGMITLSLVSSCVIGEKKCCALCCSSAPWFWMIFLAPTCLLLMSAGSSKSSSSVWALPPLPWQSAQEEAFTSQSSVCCRGCYLNKDN